MNAISYCKWCHGCMLPSNLPHALPCSVEPVEYLLTTSSTELFLLLQIVSAIALRTGPLIWMASLEFIVRWPITKNIYIYIFCRLTCNLGNLMGVTLNSGIPSFFQEGRCVWVSLIGFYSPQVCLRSQPNGYLAPRIAVSYKRTMCIGKLEWDPNTAEVSLCVNGTYDGLDQVLAPIYIF